MKQSANSNAGFGAIELLLVVVVVGLIGFAGYYAYSQKSKVDRANEGTSQSASQSNPNTSTNVPGGWLKYDKSDYTFLYPNNWTIEVQARMTRLF